MIDPTIMNQQLEAEGREPNRYQRKDNLEPMGIMEPAFEVEQEEQEEAQPPIREYNNPVHTNEEELLPGLYQSDVDSWKKQFGDVWVADVKGDQFVYRFLERYEYKEIVSVPNADPLMREEMICEYCVLYPQGYDFATMANKKAGIPAVLSELIMEHSGFTREVKVTKL
jgi:hypothetical protein